VVPYFLAPFIGYVTSGTVKYLINRIRFGEEAKKRIGNGGFPSTHTTTMVTPTMLIGFKEGFFSPVFGLAVAITFIVILDATGLRFAVGKHAKALNQLVKLIEAPKDAFEEYRESMGHTIIEVLGGIALGTLVAYILSVIF
jgi:acid phosphatase family membrane protein YuiD